MTLPSQNEIELPLLREIEAMGGEAKPKDLYPRVTAHFPQITDADLREKLPSGPNKWTNLIQWARHRLVLKKELDRYPHGVWRITEKGRERLKREQPPRPAPRPPSEPDKLAEEIKRSTEKLVELAKKGSEEAPLPSHDEVIQSVKEMGEILGKSTEPVPQAEYRHDCVWRPNRWANPELVWEVCDKGLPEKDIVSLTWAGNSWKAKGVLVLFEESNFRKAQEKFVHLPEIYLMKAQDIIQLHRMLKAGDIQALKAIFAF